MTKSYEKKVTVGETLELYGEKIAVILSVLNLIEAVIALLGVSILR